MYCCIPTPTTDSNTSTGMIWVTLNMPSAAKECREPSGKCQGIVREFHVVWRVVTLYYLRHGNVDTKFAACLSVQDASPLKLQNRFGSNFVQGWRSALDTASQLIARVGMCRILKFSTDSVFKKLNLTNIWHPLRWFSDINRMHSAIQIKSEVALLASNVRTKNILKHDRNRV